MPALAGLPVLVAAARPAALAGAAVTSQAARSNQDGGDPGLRFTDVTSSAGIAFTHNSGAFGKKYLPETLGAGVAFLDVDGDGWQDLFFVNSTNWPGRPGPPSLPALYRNNRNGTFTDITGQAGLAAPMYGLGVTAADFDNDGDVDIYVTCVGPNHLFSNQGGGRFADVTTRAGVGDPGFSTSAAWFDYDADGKLDLFVANYVQWAVATDLTCALDGRNKSYCTPELYKGQSPTLYRNKGNGTFEDVTRKAGLYDPTAKSLGVALLDYDNDGRLDLFVANDTQPNRLYRNKGDGTFADVAVMAGIAFNEAGRARAGMGVDAGDYDGSGRQSLIIGNFSNEMMALYVNEGTGLFTDDAPSSTIGRASLLTLTFATFFFDVDLDGRLDIFAANGHVADDISTVQPKVTYPQRPHLFRNAGARKFDDISARVGAPFQQPMVGRGAAYGDIDNDGDLDLVITTNNGPARLLRNDATTPRKGAIRVTLEGAASNRSAVGARVRVQFDDGRKTWSMVKTGSSYCSQSELPLTFGLGAASKASAIEVTWPNGRIEKVAGVAANQALTIREGSGIARTTPLTGGAR